METRGQCKMAFAGLGSEGRATVGLRVGCPQLTAWKDTFGQIVGAYNCIEVSKRHPVAYIGRG